MEEAEDESGCVGSLNPLMFELFVTNRTHRVIEGDYLFKFRVRPLLFRRQYMQVSSCT